MVEDYYASPATVLSSEQPDRALATVLRNAFAPQREWSGYRDMSTNTEYRVIPLQNLSGNMLYSELPAGMGGERNDGYQIRSQDVGRINERVRRFLGQGAAGPETCLEVLPSTVRTQGIEVARKSALPTLAEASVVIRDDIFKALEKKAAEISGPSSYTGR